ncbi:Putative peptidoglycan binding domain protein [Roseovarius sp. THAF27]|nr:Putative peptidoglycan binding domain protein [Roseovarius sp. THAF27]
MRVLLLVLVLSGIMPGVAPAQEDALSREIAAIDAQVAEVDATIARYDGGLVRDLAVARREALLLARQMVENRAQADRGDATVDVVVAAVTPDPAKADRLLGEMAAAQERIAEAEAEAKRSGGLIQAVALSRAETEKLTLAQLQMAYLQAKYGIAFPAPAPVTTTEPGATAALSETESQDGAANDGAASALDWADPRYPKVDYTLRPFEQASDDGDEISGWWTIERERAAIDDSPMVTAINYSEYDPQAFAGVTALLARCSEGQTAFIFIQDDFLIGDYRRQAFDMTIRIDEQEARTESWSSLTNNKGAGLFGAKAERMMRRIYEAETLFLRLVEKNGERHDASFDLAGHRDAIEAVARACGWSTLELSREDYKAIQTLLNAGGFDAGVADGQWGPGSRAAMKRFQSAKGLPETGAPDRKTLSTLGLAE